MGSEGEEADSRRLARLAGTSMIHDSPRRSGLVNDFTQRVHEPC